MPLKFKAYPFDFSDHVTLPIGGLVLACILVAGVVTAFLIEGCRWYNSRKKLYLENWQIGGIQEYEL